MVIHTLWVESCVSRMNRVTSGSAAFVIAPNPAIERVLTVRSIRQTEELAVIAITDIKAAGWTR